MILTSCDYYEDYNGIHECTKHAGCLLKCDDCEEYKSVLNQLYGGVKQDGEETPGVETKG